MRLVKGAYWDSEIKRAQEQGLDGYPVFTAQGIDRRLLSRRGAGAAGATRMLLSAIRHPQRAYDRGHHGARQRSRLSSSSGSTAWARRSSGGGRPEALGVHCRIYAPVGAHEDLLAYLVRRLLENGANTSFVNRLADDEAPIADIIADPVEQVEAMSPKPHPRIPLPVDLFAERQELRSACA